MIPIYTVVHNAGCVHVVGAIPQHEFNSLVNVWSVQYGEKFVTAPDIAQKMGYAFLAGPREKLNEMRDTLGIEVPSEPENTPDPVG